MQLELDHLAIVAPTLSEGVAEIEARLGVALAPGGVHPDMGTHNRLLGLGDGLYLEVISVDPDASPPSYPRWFALDQSPLRTQLTHWILRTPDLAQALSEAPEGAGVATSLSRGDLRWQFSLSPTGRLPFDDCFPALIQWETGVHPSTRLPDRACRLRALEVSHPEADRLKAALTALEDPRVSIRAGAPGLSAVLETPRGEVRL